MLSRTLIATLFIVILFGVITLPTVMVFSKSNCDISVFFDSEEEEKKGKESTKDIEIKVFQVSDNEIYFTNFNQELISSVYSNTYNSVYRQIFSPPPEQNIL